MSFPIPIILLIYRRPHTLAQVMAVLRNLQPSRLLIVADGPRPAFPDDPAAVAATRNVAEALDWPCEVTRIYAEANMGLRSRVESGISAAFELVERAIILEEDCVPGPSFFPFCAELLERYADDPRILNISGTNFAPHTPGLPSYRFSIYPHCWGWATWRRAWQIYDGPMHAWPTLRTTTWLETYLGDRRAAQAWRRTFDRTAAEEIDSWAYRWLYSCWRQAGLSITPSRNLVRNIGFGDGATHTTAADGPFAAMPVADLAWPLQHPTQVCADPRADRALQRTVYHPDLRWRIGWWLTRQWRRVGR
ncbi:glycosyltransferase family 2 protein [Candidatus Oscillochloris fontis]|uniref:glycosyltransferase family 2 protein n=1 Tax=Candidatus Oscillochloris fontis TaxID=2496868 RepID=UPI00101C4543|nr:glycosyltransferase family 2 protein [Candidatus Oscillochloris fontis]